MEKKKRTTAKNNDTHNENADSHEWSSPITSFWEDRQLLDNGLWNSVPTPLLQSDKKESVTSEIDFDPMHDFYLQDFQN